MNFWFFRCPYEYPWCDMFLLQFVLGNLAAVHPCICAVYLSGVLVLYTCLVYLCCIPALCTCVVCLYCIPALCTCLVYLSGVPVWWTFAVYLPCVPALCACILYLRCVPALCTCAVYLPCVPVLYTCPVYLSCTLTSTNTCVDIFISCQGGRDWSGMHWPPLYVYQQYIYSIRWAAQTMQLEIIGYIDYCI